MADVCNLFEQFFFVPGGKLPAIQENRTGITTVASHEKRRQCGFSTTALPYQGRHLPLRDHQVYTPQDLAVRLVGKTQIAAENPVSGKFCCHPLPSFTGSLLDALPIPFLLTRPLSRFRSLICIRLSIREINQPENLVTGRHTVHRDMEKTAQLPHGKKEIRGEQNDHQTSGQPHMSRLALGYRHNHAESRSPIGDQIHDRDGVELHGQHLHGNFPEFLGSLVHLLMFEFVSLVNFQCRQPLQVFQKGISQSRVFSPVSAKQLLRPGLHRRNGDRDQGNTDQQHGRRRQIHKGKHCKQRQRRQHGIEKLGQIGAEIGLQLIHALHSHLHHLRGLDLLPVGSPQLQQFAVNHSPQLLFDCLRRQKAHAAGCDTAHEADNQSRRKADHGPQKQSAVRLPMIEPLQQQGNICHNHDICRQRAPLRQHIAGNVPFALADCANQSLVNHHIVLLSFTFSVSYLTPKCNKTNYY